MKRGFSTGAAIGVVVIVVVVLGGWWLVSSRETDVITEESVPQEQNDAEVNEESEPASDGEVLAFTGKVLAGESSPLIDFNVADYEKALASDKLVVLYFYANWCPTCKFEVATGLYPAFNDLTGDDVVGFRVSFNDNDVDDDEKGLAREFNVTYQQTKVFLKNGERVLKAPDVWGKKRYLSEIKNAS